MKYQTDYARGLRKTKAAFLLFQMNEMIKWRAKLKRSVKTKFILCIALIWSSHALAQSTNVYHRISVAEVGTVRLEVEQFTNWQNGIYIRVHDYAASARQKTNVVCDLYWIAENGKEAKENFLSVTLNQAAPRSDDYSGQAAGQTEFEHGNKFKIVYKSDGLELPISTWYACYYH